MGAFGHQVVRDFVITFRSGPDAANPVAFFVLAVLVFSFGIGPSADAIGDVGSGVIWVLALFSSLLSMEAIFRRDYDDGSLEQMLLHAKPVFLAVLAKLVVHWSFTGLLVVLLSPLAAYVLNVPGDAMGTLMLTLLLGTPVLTAIGAIGAALTVGTGRGGLLIAILVMPFYVPVLIFGAGASITAVDGRDATAHLLWLTAMLAGSVTLAPFVVARALQISQEY